MIRARAFALAGALSLSATLSLAGCPANNTCPATGSDDAGTPAPGSLGGPVIGPTDHHCWATGSVDGGTTFQAQATALASCAFDQDAGPMGPEYGPTSFNTASNDDDCKHAVAWHSTPISKGAAVTFWFSTLYATNGAPVTGMVATADGGAPVPSCIGEQAPQIYFEVAGDPDGGIYNHSSPIYSPPIAETPPGSGIYQIGPSIFFDESGLWYIRFHFNENCCDILADSPHGHAAFYINVP